MSEERNRTTRGSVSAVVAAAALASRRAQAQTTGQLPAPRPAPFVRPTPSQPKLRVDTRPSLPDRAPSSVSTDSDVSISSIKTITAPKPAAAAAAAVQAAPHKQATRSPADSPRRHSRAASVTARPTRPPPTAVKSPMSATIARPQVSDAAAAAAAFSRKKTADTAPAQPKHAAAAARSSSLNPLKIEPRQGLQDKLLSALTPEKNDKPQVEKLVAAPVRDKRDDGRAAARYSSQSVPHFETAQPVQRSAVAAAALARPNADLEVAKIDLNVENKQKRKNRFQPAASWSTGAPPSESLQNFSHLMPLSSNRQPSSSECSSETEPKKHNHLSSMLHKLGIKKHESLSPPPPPSQPSVPAAPEPSTMRKDKKNKFNEHKPWKHHHDAKVLSEKERRRYERLWAANKGSHIPYFVSEALLREGSISPGGSTPSLHTSTTSTLPVGTPVSVLPRLTVTDDIGSPVDTPSDFIDGASVVSFRSSIISSGDSDHYDPQVDDVHYYVVSNLWRRSQLPDDILAKVWDLIDHNHDGTLDRESFIVGTWLVDQCLYGRKLPTRITDQIWTSSGRLNVKLRVKQKNHHHPKFRRTHNAAKKLNAAGVAAIRAAREQARSPTPQSITH